MLATPEVPGAVAAIARLVIRFNAQVWLVSKCGPRIQARTRRWLDAHDFYRRTRLAPDHLRFCRTRRDKRLHCQDLALTHFVDDDPQVHAAIHDTIDHQYFFGPQRRPVPDYGQHTPTWTDAEHLINQSLPQVGTPKPNSFQTH